MVIAIILVNVMIIMNAEMEVGKEIIVVILIVGITGTTEVIIVVAIDMKMILLVKWIVIVEDLDVTMTNHVDRVRALQVEDLAMIKHNKVKRFVSSLLCYL
jgi:hypothetical protein